MMKVKPLGAHLAHLTEQELIDGEYTVMWTFDPKSICPNCGDDRTGKGSLIVGDTHQQFCNDNCFEEWHAAKMGKYDGV